MNRPIEPDKEDCCNSGCNPCIFDIYQKQLEVFEKYQSGQLIKPSDHQDNFISQTKYTPFKITYKEKLCNEHWLIAFKTTTDKKDSKVMWNPGQHFIMKHTDEDLTISRAYTPLRLQHLSCRTRDYDFLIIIKKYQNGKVSNFLCESEIGLEIFWRGPYGSFEYVVNKYNRICMIAQGTGIAPFFSIITTVLDNEDDYSNLNLFCCFKTIDTILFRKELYSFRQYWNFNYWVFLSQPFNPEEIFYKEPIEHRKFDIDCILNYEKKLEDTVFFVCGSVEFIKAYTDGLKYCNVPDKNIITF